MLLRPAAGFLLAAAATAGCGGAKPGGATHPVEGVLTIGGKAAENVQVRFQPDPTKGGTGTGATGTTGAGGKYTLKTDDGRDGAAAGWYVVSLTDAEAGRVEQGEKEKGNRVPAAYQSATKSPLHVEVKAGPNTIPLDAR